MSEIPESDYANIRKAVVQTGDEIYKLMNNKELLDYSTENVAGHRSLIIDIRAEDIIVKNLQELGIGGQVISEETGHISLDGSETPYTFIIDPLDGSTNYKKGIPFSCISVGISNDFERFSYESLKYGIIYDFNSKTIYEIINGKLYVNGTTFTRSSSDQPLVISYYNYGKSCTNQLYNFERKARIRTLGSAALEMVYLARGGLNAFIDVRGSLGTYDFAVAAKFITLMGGTVAFYSDDFKGTIPYDAIMLNEIKSNYKIIATFDQQLHEMIVSDLCPCDQLN